MKRFAYFLVASICALPLASHAAQTAQARLFCTSVKFHQLRNSWGDRLDFTSTGMRDAGLGELYAWPPPGDFTYPLNNGYQSNLLIQGYDGSAWNGVAYLGLPYLEDLNNNRMPDFFEVSLPAYYSYYSGPMNISGPWSYSLSVIITYTRAAGNPIGHVTINTQDPDWGTFGGEFEILEYLGTLSYTPGTNTITCTINATQTTTNTPPGTVTGPINFTKSTTDHYNEITNNIGAWSGTLLSTVHTFTNHYFWRDVNFPTNFAGLIEFTDYDPSWYEPYMSWILSITDTNDLNHNGYPDFIDDSPVLPPPNPPQLTLTRGAGNLQLKIVGDTGHLHTIQETTSLGTPNWQMTTSFTLTNNQQTITLPLPAGPKYWRAFAQ